MRTLVWIAEDTREATVDETVALVPPDAWITLLHVAGSRLVWPDEAPSPATLPPPPHPPER